MEITFLNCFIMLSAVWRISNLFANEDGPFMLFERIRHDAVHLASVNRFFGALHFYQGLTCEWCNSIWFAVPAVAAWWYFGKVVLLIVLPLAVSAWVIVFKYGVHLIQNAEEYYAEQVTLLRFMSARNQESKFLADEYFKMSMGQKQQERKI